MKRLMQPAFTIIIILVIIGTAGITRIKLDKTSQKHTKALENVIKNEDNLSKFNQKTITMLIKASKDGDTQKKTISKSCMNTLRGYISDSKSELTASQRVQMSKLVSDLTAIMGLDGEDDFAKLPVDARGPAIVLLKQIYAMYSLNLKADMNGEICEITDYSGKIIYQSNNQSSLMTFNFNIFLITVIIILVLFKLVITLVKKNMQRIGKWFTMGIEKKEMPNKYLLITDVMGLILSFLLSSWTIYGRITGYWNNNIYAAAFLIVLFIYTVIYFLFDTYSKLFRRGLFEEMIIVIKINCLLAVSMTAILFVFKEGATFSRLFFFLFLFLNILIIYILRQFYKMFLLTIYQKSNLKHQIMIISTSDQINSVLERFHNANELEYQITYLTILDQSQIGQRINDIEVKADLRNMYEIAKKEAIDNVFIHLAPDSMPGLNIEEMILKFQNMGITVDLGIHTFDLSINEKLMRQMCGYHVLTFSNNIYDKSQLVIKRLIDIAGGLIGCLITIILAIIIAPAIFIESPGPIFFSQTRIGKNGRRFRIYKFRSMYPNAEKRLSDLAKNNEMDGYMFKMKNDPRVTKVGSFLRKTSIDEFPQFFNVLKGDMSLVGTRPPTESELIQYETRHKRRLSLKTGITGLWQVNGRSDITDFEDVVKLDLEYIDNWSLMMDLKILFKTIGVVLFQKGSR